MSIGLGDNANASQDYAMALGAESEAAENATAIGNKAHAKGVNSIALGNGSQALADSAIAIRRATRLTALMPSLWVMVASRVA